MKRRPWWLLLLLHLFVVICFDGDALQEAANGFEEDGARRA